MTEGEISGQAEQDVEADREDTEVRDGDAAVAVQVRAHEAQIEIPSWLEEIDVGETAEAPEAPAFMASAEGPLEAEELTFAPEEEAPEWLMGAGEGLEFPEGVEQEPGGKLAMGEEDMGSDQVAVWLRCLSTGAMGGEL